MNKKIVLFLVAFMVIIAAVKTGYALQPKKIQSEAATLKAETLVETKVETKEETKEEADTSTTTSMNCFGNSEVNMFDEKGAIKDRATFEQELNQSVENGDITDEQKQNYLTAFDQCSERLSENSSEADGELGIGEDSDVSDGLSCH